MKTRILVDMDGVLTDFVGGALRIHGWTREAFEKIWPVMSYDLAKPMGLTEDEFWKPIHKMHEVFWMGLQPLPWVHELMDLVQSITDDWYVVSAPSRDPCSLSGKLHWLKRFFGDQSFNRFVPTIHKHLLATSRDVLLIDDWEENIEKFVKGDHISPGGNGLLFPSRHNKLHEFAGDPVGYIQNILTLSDRVQRDFDGSTLLQTLEVFQEGDSGISGYTCNSVEEFDSMVEQLEKARRDARLEQEGEN